MHGDWNDLAQVHGKREAKKQLEVGLKAALAANDTGEQSSPAPTPEERGHAGGAAGDGTRWTKTALIEHCMLVYGTDMVWDSRNRIYMRLSHLRHAIGRELFKTWEESPSRKIVYGLKFEPGQNLGKQWVNLWEGFGVTPDPRGQEGCQRILDHFYRLCRFRQAEFNWLMRWIALPVQQPGAKMDSSVVMFGAEGPGKSAVWENVVMPIYGEAATTIGQAQLESQFTGWQAGKCFALAEEVVSRAEKSHYKGQLKHLVTGKSVRINEKHAPERVETNHLNVVFLSNETVPLLLDQGDRRYLVLYADDVPDQDYFHELFAEISNGGVECFMHYLLNLPLGDFGTWTRPPLNEEKEGLVEMGMSTALYFHKQWQDGDLELPYGAVASADLWAVFCRWCERNNEYKRRQRDLAADLKRVMKSDRRDLQFPKELGPKKTIRLWVPPELYKRRDMPGYLDEVGQQARAFYMAAQGSWVRPDGDGQ
jgi:putative DNA primase/helicase